MLGAVAFHTLIAVLNPEYAKAVLVLAQRVSRALSLPCGVPPIYGGAGTCLEVLKSVAEVSGYSTHQIVGA